LCLGLAQSHCVSIVADSSESLGIKWAAPASGATFVGASVFNTGTQSISTATNTILTFNSELWDTDGFHSTSTNTGRFTIPAGKAGKYLVNMLALIDENGTRQRNIQLYKNGSALYDFFVQQEGGNGTDQNTIQGSIVVDLAVSDYIYLQYYQLSGTSKNIDMRQAFGAFQITYLGA
jgi:hypothetical protein